MGCAVDVGGAPAGAAAPAPARGRDAANGLPRCCWPPTLGLPPGDESGFWFHMIPPARHPRSLPRIYLKGPLDRERRRGMIARSSSRPSPPLCVAMRPGVGFDVGAVRSRGRDPRGIAAPIHAYAALSACGTAARPLVKTKGLFPRSPRQLAPSRQRSSIDCLSLTTRQTQRRSHASQARSSCRPRPPSRPGFTHRPRSAARPAEDRPLLGVAPAP